MTEMFMLCPNIMSSALVHPKHVVLFSLEKTYNLCLLDATHISSTRIMPPFDVKRISSQKKNLNFN